MHLPHPHPVHPFHGALGLPTAELGNLLLILLGLLVTLLLYPWKAN